MRGIGKASFLSRFRKRPAGNTRIDGAHHTQPKHVGAKWEASFFDKQVACTAWRQSNPSCGLIDSERTVQIVARPLDDLTHATVRFGDAGVPGDTIADLH